MSNQINTKTKTPAKAKRWSVIALAAVAVALFTAPVIDHSASAAFIGPFCVKGSGFGGEFTGHAGGTYCQATATPAPTPTPTQEIDATDRRIDDLSLTTTNLPMNTKAATKTVGYRVWDAEGKLHDLGSVKLGRDQWEISMNTSRLVQLSEKSGRAMRVEVRVDDTIYTFNKVEPWTSIPVDFGNTVSSYFYDIDLEAADSVSRR